MRKALSEQKSVMLTDVAGKRLAQRQQFLAEPAESHELKSGRAALAVSTHSLVIERRTENTGEQIN